ncbi:MAG: putative DNA-binding domain-containing protein [Alphaproteobacteria bacterium]|nr:putative DNA-binding domain-containing protein [Alphaproteobacteria bacterium SS10]
MPSPLSAHFEQISAFIDGKAGSESLSDLMAGGVDPGPKALIYRNSSVMAGVDALRSNYPAVAMVMGDAFFQAMARAYVDKHRNASRSLVGFGDTLPDFITDAEAEHKLPWLSDLARLDRGWLLAHLAPEQTPLDPRKVAEMGGRGLDGALLDLADHVHLIDIGYGLYDLWLQLRAGQAPEATQEVATEAITVLAWRFDQEVQSRPLTPSETAFLRCLKQELSISAALDLALADDPALEPQTLFAATLSAGLFTDIRLPTEQS